MIAQCGCMTYEVDGVEDVAAYDLDCPIHGWRWNYTGPAMTLEEAAKRDDERREALADA